MVCEAWRKIYNQFVIDMGPPPHKDAAIHRINNDGNYEPTNCVWITRSENIKLMNSKNKPLSEKP